MNPTLKRSLRQRSITWTDDVTDPASFDAAVNQFLDSLNDNPEATVLQIRYSSEIAKDTTSYTGVLIAHILYTE